MKHHILFSLIGGDRRMAFARQFLEDNGYATTHWRDPACTHYILPLPAFQGKSIPDGPTFSEFLSALHPGAVVLGGKLDAHRAELEHAGAYAADYFRHEPLIATNARLTAEGAVALAAGQLPIALWNTPALVCGWGRIGKHCARLLHGLGARVSVSARDPKDLAMIQSMGYHAVQTGKWQRLSSYRLIVNTIPAPVFTLDDLLLTRQNCCRIDLASLPGFPHCPQYPATIASGLPGIYAPESAGQAIGEAILALCGEERSL